MVQEVDVRTGLVVWEWHAYGHIPLADSYATPANSASYDAYHLNSIDFRPPNRVLVSARDTSAIYLVDRATGRIRWTLGGRPALSGSVAAPASTSSTTPISSARTRCGCSTTRRDRRSRRPSRGLLLDLDLRHAPRPC